MAVIPSSDVITLADLDLSSSSSFFIRVVSFAWLPVCSLPQIYNTI